MAEGGVGEAKIRVVRCPKCRKLLPELLNFTIYRCGSCGATLQAKKQNPATAEASPANSDVERMKNLGTLESSSEKKGVVLDGSSETGGEGVNVEAKKYEPSLSNIIALSKNEERDVSVEHSNSRLDAPSEETRKENRETRYRHSSDAPISDLKPDVDELVKGYIKKDRETKAQLEHTTGLHKVHQVKAPKGDERDGVSAFHRVTRAGAEGIHLAPYPDEGPSNYYSNLRYRPGAGGPIRKHNSDLPSGIEHLEQDQAELLRKLDELRDQLRRPCKVTDKSKARLHLSRTVSMSPCGSQGRGSWFPEGSRLNYASAQRSSFLHRHNIEVPNFYPTLHAHPDIPGYREPILPHTLRKAPFHHPGQYQTRPLDNYLYGQFDPDPFISYHHDSFYHQPACSCVHCYNRQWPVPAQALPTVFRNPRVPFLVNSNHGVYRVHNSPMFSPQVNQRTTDDSAWSHEPKLHQRATSNRKDGSSLQPVAGAAPFVVCHNCFELLQLPQKFSLAVNSMHKLRCGSCSQAISFKLDGKRLVASVPAPTLNVISETNSNSSDGPKDCLPFQPHTNKHSTTSHSGDYDSPGYDLPSTDEKLVLPSTFSVSSNELFEKEYEMDSRKAEKTQGLSSSPSMSENVESTDQRDVRSSADLPVEAEEASHAPGVPLREHFVYLSSNHVMDGPGKGSRSKRTAQEKILSIHGSFKQNAIKDVEVVNEMDVLVDEYPNPGVSQDSWDVGNGEDQLKVSKGGESFFAGLIKKSFMDFSRFNSADNSSPKVLINGHPISDRLVKKAEKQAGQIHPGDYWYDNRAGFWGVMGHACLGIIPPFIEEFNYPMPIHCAGGNTGVLVNGRELHWKDLDLLAGRGLPTTRGRSYIIEISGKVWDEDSGQELNSLGKLAPTVEKVKHGFGMRVPRIIA